MRRSAAPSQRGGLPRIAGSGFQPPVRSSASVLELLNSGTSTPNSTEESSLSLDDSSSRVSSPLIQSGQPSRYSPSNPASQSTYTFEAPDFSQALQSQPCPVKPLVQRRPMGVLTGNVRPGFSAKNVLLSASNAGNNTEYAGNNPGYASNNTGYAGNPGSSTKSIDNAGSQDGSKSYRYFSCVWCKKSGRKHKKWEGDALLKVGERSVVLFDMEGKEIGRGSGYKKQELVEVEDGGRLGVGSREVEIMGEMKAEEWRKLLNEGAKKMEEEKVLEEARKLKESTEDRLLKERNVLSKSEGLCDISTVVQKAKFKPFKIPSRVGGDSLGVTPKQVCPGQPMFDPACAGALVMPRPPLGHALQTDRMVDVVVDPHLTKHLRPHQRSGVVFLYSRVAGFKQVTALEEDEQIRLSGAILADEMGLGKTLQTITLVWTLLRQSPVAGSVMAKRVLVIAPSSLLKNWEAEFRKWLGSERLVVHVADGAAKVSVFRSYNTAPVLILSYETLVRSIEEVSKVSWDLIVCDEAHRLKNAQIKTSAALASLPCPRRVLLTGTPVQNDLGEFHSLASAAAPGLLGSRGDFSKRLENAIEAGRQPEAEEDEKAAGQAAMKRLADLTQHLVLRRTSDVINKFLPPKTVNVVFCRPSQYQAFAYCAEVERLLGSVLLGGGGAGHLEAISTLRKLCNAPGLVGELPGPGEGGPSTWEEQSGKLSALTCLLLAIAQAGREKVVVVSLSTAALDMIQQLCDRYQLSTCRLDGSTPSSQRQTIVNNFNAASSQTNVFLLSSKAGGTGLNLVGASRIVLYDIDWNPATDLQAMARVWRDGQTRHCHIYRFITTGTIEEKMYQRQVTKSGLAGGLAAAGLLEAESHFTAEELKDLFTFRDDTECETHDLIGCSCGGSGVTEGDDEAEAPGGERTCQLGQEDSQGKAASGAAMEELKKWRHYTSPLQERIEDEALVMAEMFISYVFRHTVEPNLQQ